MNLRLCFVLVLLVVACEPPSAQDMQEPYSSDVGDESALGVTSEALSAPASSQTVLAAQDQRLAVGQSHACRLFADGRVKCWGLNSDGRLGLGDRNTRGDEVNEMGDNLPYVALGAGRTAISIAATSSGTCALMERGTVKCWGDNSVGQLGRGHADDIGAGPNEMGDALPDVALGVRRTVMLAAGHRHMCALADDGTVRCWGLNADGQLGEGNTVTRGTSSTQMGTSMPTVPFGTRKALSIACGTSFSCALLDDNSIKCWGANESGQLGQGHVNNLGDGAGEVAAMSAIDLGTVAKPVGIAAGGNQACALLEGGRVKCWGASSSGALGLGDTRGRGDNPAEMGNALPFVDLGTNRVAIALNATNGGACALLDNGKLKCWGGNGFGNLGSGDALNRGDQPGEMGDNLAAVDTGTGFGVTAIATSPTSTSVCVERGDGSIKCWGNNTVGQLGLGHTESLGDAPNEMGDRLMPVYLRRSLALGAHSCALIEGGVVKCWGKNSHGQLGLGHSQDVGDNAGEMSDALPAVILPAPATSIAVGGFHSCAILSDGKLKCWGQNAYYQLGTGDGSNYNRGDSPGELPLIANVNFGTVRTPRALALGEHHSCALLDDGSVKCWGRNDTGQCGQSDAGVRGYTASDIAYMPPIKLGTGRTARAIAAGNQHTCALLDDATVKCWGRNDRGQLGRGDVTSYGGSAGQMAALTPIALGNVAPVALTARGDHTCVLLADGMVKCWGANAFGQLGVGDTANRGDNANEMGASLSAVRFGVGRRARAVRAGGNFTCALLDDNSLKCWGKNDVGQLGQGDVLTRGDNPGELDQAVLSGISVGTGRFTPAFEVGVDHACALNERGAIQCWGRNSSGELGLGNMSHRGDQAGELGAALPPVLIGANRQVKDIEANVGSTCAFLEEGSVVCWGWTDACNLTPPQDPTGYLGDEPKDVGNGFPRIALGAQRTARQLVHGIDHTCALLDDGSVKCWGRGGFLGNGDFLARGCTAPGGDSLPPVDLGSGKTAISLVAGYNHTCALLNDGTTRCWGANRDGELGVPTSDDTVGDEPGEMGAALVPIDFGNQRQARSLFGSETRSTCAVLNDGTTHCWGDNRNGHLGLGHVNDVGAIAGEAATVTTVNVGTAERARWIRTSESHACALMYSGAVKCWGNIAYLGLGPLTGQSAIGDQPNEMGDSLAIVQLGTDWSVQSFALGGGHNCALLGKLGASAIKCWGLNSAGQLGLGDYSWRGDDAGEMGSSLPTLSLGTGLAPRAISAASEATCALLTNGTVKCWGATKQLGNGGVHGGGPNEMGDKLPILRFGD